MQLGTDEKSAHLLTGLTAPQREAVLHVDGPLLILAGPGSGKTRVVTRRAAHLALNVIAPYRILAITFTNKAAKEMRERIDALHVGRGMIVSTFHALCARLLREYAQRAGLERNFTIFDREDRRKVIKEAIANSQLSAANWQPAAVESVISDAKNRMLDPVRFEAQVIDWRERTVAKIYYLYEKMLQDMNGLDFDDLLMRTATVLSRDQELKEELQDRFRYVLIDEYQDTNDAQYTIARMLSDGHQNLCATGDPDQSIYGWRGANIENILRFERDFPGAKVVRLEQNYRSTKRIVAAADAIIANNTQRKAKKLWTENAAGLAVRVCEFESADDEAAAIAKEIKAILSAGERPDGIAVFYRVNSLSRVLEEAMLRAGVAYQIARGVEFYNRKEIKDVLAYLRVLVNPADEIALLRIINTPTRGIGDTTVDRLKSAAQRAGQTIFDHMLAGDGGDELGRAAAKVYQFARTLADMRACVEKPAPQALEHVMLHSGLRAMYKEEGDADASPSANLDELISAASAFAAEFPEATLVDWLEHAALISDVDAVRAEGTGATLMTLHAAKGLEFDVVYIVGLEDGLLPFRRRDEGSVDVEEERRLCFVGMTRARKRLTLSRAKYRAMRGVAERTTRSDFLDELPRDQVEWEKPQELSARGAKTPATDGGQLPPDIELWDIGTLVRHAQHGLGQVLSLHRGTRRTHVDVLFKDGSRRSWILEFANLQRVEFDEVG